MAKQYIYKNDVTYSQFGRKWLFKHPTYELLYPAPGGNQTAAKIAAQFRAGLVRTNFNGLDALSRGAIRKLANY